MFGKLFGGSQNASPTPSQEYFTRRAKRVLSSAQKEVERLQHNQIGPEHVLVGLMMVEDTFANRVLLELGVQKQQLQLLVAQGTRAKKQRPGPLQLNEETKHVLRLSLDEARNMGNQYIGSEHLLLGLLAAPNGRASAILRLMNVNPDEVYSRTRDELLEGGTADITSEEILATLLSSDTAQKLRLRIIVKDKSDGTVKTQATIPVKQLQESLINLLHLAVTESQRGKQLEFEGETDYIEIFVDEEAT